MKTFFYALGALAIVTTTAAQADDAIKQQSESYAVERGDYAARADRDRPIATVQLRRDGDATDQRASAPREDRWMFQSSRTDTVYGD